VSPTLSTLVGDLVGETADGLAREPTGADVDDALARLFPPLRAPPVGLLARVLDDERLDAVVPEWRPGETAVRVDGLYLHPELADDPSVAEFPPIERELGVAVLETVDPGDGVGRLTDESVAAVRRAVRDRLAADRRTVDAAFADGVPTGYRVDYAELDALAAAATE
jgi:hypothetical protein